jgi:hypothetical protein
MSPRSSVMGNELRVPWNAEKFLNSYATGGLSRTAHVHGVSNYEGVQNLLFKDMPYQSNPLTGACREKIQAIRLTNSLPVSYKGFAFRHPVAYHSVAQSA